MYQSIPTRFVPHLYAPYYTLNTAGTVLCESPLFRLGELSFCGTFYLEHDPTMVNETRDVDETLCKIDSVQSELAALLGLNFLFDGCCWCISSILVDKIFD